MNAKKPSNPQVFPVTEEVHVAGRMVPRTLEGMTLRDWFAGQFMAALIGSHSNLGTSGSGEMARMAYAHADAMLKAREEE